MTVLAGFASAVALFFWLRAAGQRRRADVLTVRLSLSHSAIRDLFGLVEDFDPQSAPVHRYVRGRDAGNEARRALGLAPIVGGSW